jgi:hypothetical protein
MKASSARKASSRIDLSRSRYPDLSNAIPLPGPPTARSVSDDSSVFNSAGRKGD